MQAARVQLPTNRPRGALMEHKQLFETIKKDKSAREISYEELCRQADENPSEEPDDTIFLDWFGEGYIITYGISLSKPDWDFLDTWYDDEVQALYDMNSESILAPSLLAYMRSRQKP